jgi:hypothetical protein
MMAQNYRGEVQIGGMFGMGEDFGTLTTIHTAHGVVFDENTFVGAGVGVGSNLAGKLEIPLYGRFSQSFRLSPSLQVFSGLNTGLCLDENLSYGLYLSPDIGLQVGRIKFFINYSYRNLLKDSKETADGMIMYNTTKFHCFGAGLGFVFGKK